MAERKKVEKLEVYTVFLDGIDKTGKDTIAKYVWNLDKRLNVICRGWPSLVVYAEKFKRNVEYALPYKNALYVHLTVMKDDWRIRCNITNEPTIDFEYDTDLFKGAFNILIQNEYHTLELTTSCHTPYKIAKMIVEEIMLINRRLQK